jgi:hypothetical protein
MPFTCTPYNVRMPNIATCSPDSYQADRMPAATCICALVDQVQIVRDGRPSQFELFQLYFKFELHLIVETLIPECSNSSSSYDSLLGACYPKYLHRAQIASKRETSVFSATTHYANRNATAKIATVLRLGAAIEVFGSLMSKIIQDWCDGQHVSRKYAFEGPQATWRGTRPLNMNRSLALKGQRARSI